MSFALNPQLAGLPVYQPGRPIEEVARELGLPVAHFVKLASNENPLGPSPRALKAIARTLPHLNLYPDGNGFYLKQELARRHHLPIERLALGNGSNDLLELLGHALLQPGDEVVVSQFCFAVYPIVTNLFGAKLVTVPARNFGHDLPAMQQAVTGRTKLLFVANPNNPTGTLASKAAVLRLIRETPAHVVIVLDEAYIDFLEQPQDLIPLVRKDDRPNLILLRTFSKIYGLAGLRLGYAMGNPTLIAALEKVRQPFNTNMLAQVAALAALDDTPHLRKTRENNLAGLKTLAQGFARLGLRHVPSAANFVLVQVNDGKRVFESMQKAGVIVRPMGVYALPEWIRITVGTPRENIRCLAALAQALGKSGARKKK
jgi:histidinol-phosphate aminotransferase